MTLSGKRVLVTGSDGFIGSHLAERLVQEGANVRAFVCYNSSNSWGWLDDSPARDQMEVVAGDIRDSGFVKKATTGCDLIFHLAALIAIPYSYDAPESFVQTNVVGTINVLNAAREAGIERVIHTSTSEVYGTPRTVPITEDHPLQGQSPYSASKIAADTMVESYSNSFNLPVVTLRPFNTYGPRQSARAVIPAILTQLLSGRQDIKLGSASPRRDFTYVDDTVAGFLAAGTAPGIEGAVVHLGTGRDISIGELFELICTTLGVSANILVDDVRVRPERSEVDQLLSDPHRAGDVLQWTPQVSLESGIARTAEWLRGHLGRYKVDRYNV